MTSLELQNIAYANTRDEILCCEKMLWVVFRLVIARQIQ